MRNMLQIDLIGSRWSDMGLARLVFASDVVAFKADLNLFYVRLYRFGECHLEISLAGSKTSTYQHYKKKMY